jgi:RimJ/RimL family protein N-acetyltransferase
MIIENSNLSDVSKIFELYSMATAYMKSKNQVHWPEFSKELINHEIEEKRQWKLVIDGHIACIWAIDFNDDLIWGDKNNDPSIYIHRITTNPSFRGQNLVKQLIDWANDFGKSKDLQYIRMDTVGMNHGLINHYARIGFQFLGTKKLENTDRLPAHYKDGEVCFFQKEIS